MKLSTYLQSTASNPALFEVIEHGTHQIVFSGLTFDEARMAMIDRHEQNERLERLFRGETTKALIQNNGLTTTPEPRPHWWKAALSVAFVVAIVVAVFANAAQYKVSEDVPYAVPMEGGR